MKRSFKRELAGSRTGQKSMGPNVDRRISEGLSRVGGLSIHAISGMSGSVLTMQWIIIECTINNLAQKVQIAQKPGA